MGAYKNKNGYGTGDNSYRAAGGLQGIARLVDEFYTNMDVLPQAKIIRNMHPQDLSESRKKLAYFLCGWLGGPDLYAKHFGSVNIPAVHAHLAIGKVERDAWLYCMQQAISAQQYEKSFKQYLLAQLTIPAERIKQRCAH